MDTSMNKDHFVLHVPSNVKLVKITLMVLTTDVLPVNPPEKTTHHIVTVQMVQLLMKTESVSIVTINVLIVMVLLIIVSSVLPTDLKSHIVDVHKDTMIMVITQNVNYVWIFVSLVLMLLDVLNVKDGENNPHQSVHVQKVPMKPTVTNVGIVLHNVPPVSELQITV
jgi:hypothetical protein